MDKEKERICVEVPASWKAQLEALAAERGENVSTVVRSFLRPNLMKIVPTEAQS